MNKIEKLVLLEGDFTYEEGSEILTNLFQSKVNFHNLKNWSSQERYGIDDPIASKRIPALRKEMEKLQALLVEAKKNNKNLKVSSEIRISIEEAT